jgi:hypothetical protein
MEGTSEIEHDRWMEKIAEALRSFRMASLRKAKELSAPPTTAESAAGEPGDRDSVS